MGTTNSTPVPANAPVLPGTNYIQTYYTDLGWSAGDYIYKYGSGSVGPNPAFTATLPGVTINMTIAQDLYQATYGTGVNPTRASYTSPTTVPSFTYNCAVTSSLGSNFTAPATIVSTAVSSFTPASVTLTNGNIVTCFHTSSSTLLYRVTTPTGTLVGNGTVSTTVSTSQSAYRPFALCALNAGGFAVGFYDTSLSGVTIRTYSATGTFLAQGVPEASSQKITDFFGEPTMAADDTDNIYFMGRNSSNYYAIFVIPPSLTTYTQVATRSVSTNFPYYLLLMPGYIVFSYGQSSGPTSYTVDVWTASSTSTPLSSYTISATAPFCGVFLAPAIGGNYILAYMNQSGSMISSVYARTSTTPLYTTTVTGFWNGSSSSTTAFGGTPYAGTTTGTYDGLNPANSVILYAGNSNSSFMRSVIIQNNGVSLTASSTALTSIPFRQNDSGGNPPNQGSTYSYCQTFTPSTCVTYVPNATAFPTIAGAGTFTTALTGNSLPFPVQYVTTPQNGYTLLGVSTAAASANTYGSIVINGVVPLSSSYGTSNTVRGFNFNPINGYGFLGNRGYVVSRIVTLQGLE